ncbi:MAG TPA: amino acid ABC transporter permease, partial [Bordetella sp.]
MMEFFNDAVEYLPVLLQGVKLTILVTLGSLVLSTLLGLV